MHPESIDSGTCCPSNRHRPSGENKLAKNTFVKIKKRKQTPNETDKVNLGSYSVHLNPPKNMYKFYKVHWSLCSNSDVTALCTSLTRRNVTSQTKYSTAAA